MTTTTFFYDGQIRRYLLQIIRLLSNFAVKYGDGTLVRVPVMYGDPDRQVSSIINQNSENTVLSAPRIAVYVTDIELDTSRLSDSSYVGKVHIRERAINETTGQYENYQGNTFTVERLMPTPYKLSVKVDIWSSSNDQKLQILEQILMLFNPSLEIQTTDNYIDWTSLSVVDLVQTTYSSRSVPVGTSTEIDIATLTLATPIWISPPAKVKRLGVITEIISNIFSQQSSPYGDYYEGLGTDPEATSIVPVSQIASTFETSGNYDIEVTSNSARLIGFNSQQPNWEALISKYPGTYVAGLSRIYLKLSNGNQVVGYFSLNILNPNEIIINWDVDTYPSNTSLITESRPTSPGTFDAIIDPKKTGPRDAKLPPLEVGRRFLIIDDIGGGVKDTFIAENRIQRINTNVLHNRVNDHQVFVNGVEVGSGSLRIPDDIGTGMYYIILDEAAPANSEIKWILNLNEDGPDAWKNLNGTDFIAEENDIIEWDGNKWNVIYDADENSNQIIHLTNIYSGSQYVFNGVSWSYTFEGIYRKGEWRIEL
jgi:hypothetical protein